MFDITPILEAVIALVCVIITCVLVPYIRSKTTLSQQQEISDYVAIAVSAAEQIFKKDGKGREKKEYVLAWLRERNIAVGDSKIDAMIESAVHELNSGILLGEPITVTTEATIETDE